MAHWMKAAFICPIMLIGNYSVVFAEKFAVISKRTIYPGQIINLEDLKSVRLIREPTISYHFASKPEEIVGTLAKRTILPERFIPLGSIQAAPTIKAGTPTRVAFQSGGLSISVVCVPLTDGVSGEFIRFRNPSSGKIITAEISADGSAIARKL